MQQKIYSAFISSVFESLREERSEIINYLLDYHYFPVCMEHFTVSANGRFKDIQEYISNSDFFILILGREYGSCDENGISWTEREYDYAVQEKKPILAIVCEEMQELLKKENCTEAEQKQIAFCKKVSFARNVTKELTVAKILMQFLSSLDVKELSGWVRAKGKLSASELAAWQKEHAAFDLGGVWYHAHLSADDAKYLRIGTITVLQNFTPDEYQKLRMEGYNHNAKYIVKDEKGILQENVLARSRWEGEYLLDEFGKAVGLFTVRREFSGAFAEQRVDRGIRRGIHDFSVSVGEGQKPEFFTGEFHDEAPSPKTGCIYAFRTPEARQKYLEDNFKQVLMSEV